MTHTSCSSRWTLTECDWTSTQVRRQSTTRIQIAFAYRESYGFQFDQQQIVRQAIEPVLPLDPTAVGMDAIAEMRNNAKRKRAASPTLSEAPSGQKRIRVHTQTDIQLQHLDKIPRKLIKD